MNLPWWVWVLAAVYCLPGVYCAVALTYFQPTPFGLDDDGNPYKLFSPARKLVTVPILGAVLAALWPVLAWEDRRWKRRNRAAGERTAGQVGNTHSDTT